MGKKPKVDYRYLIVTAYNPEEYKNKFLYGVSGLHDEDSFIQPVMCPECDGEVFVMFDAYGMPEVGQCVNCGKLHELYYKIDDWKNKWRNNG